MPLGHMLTFRIAYQIAAGLAYLHRKNIIFCDLKSDNILVWSLEVGVERVCGLRVRTLGNTLNQTIKSIKSDTADFIDPQIMTALAKVLLLSLSFY